MRFYRLIVVGCALSWLMVGLHLPVVHRITHHGHTPSWGVLGLLSLFALAAVAGLWTLLRARVS